MVTVDPGDVTGINMWTFIWDGSTATIYKNKNSLVSGSIVNPTGAHPSNTNWGARHNNSGSSYADSCPGKYRRLLRWNSALNNGAVTINYNSFKSYYNLP